MVIGVTTTLVDDALVLAASALPAPHSAKAITASFKPFEVKRVCLFILVFLRLDKRHLEKPDCL
jgi:hypothetical protein